jgi:hypothetical protein
MKATTAEAKNAYTRSGMDKDLDTRYQGRQGTGVRVGNLVTTSNPSKKCGFSLKSSPLQVSVIAAAAMHNLVAGWTILHSVLGTHDNNSLQVKAHGANSGLHQSACKIKTPKMSAFLPHQEFWITIRRRIWKTLDLNLTSRTSNGRPEAMHNYSDHLLVEGLLAISTRVIAPETMVTAVLDFFTMFQSLQLLVGCFLRMDLMPDLQDRDT